jgi:hypothetical protein
MVQPSDPPKPYGSKSSDGVAFMVRKGNENSNTGKRSA